MREPGELFEIINDWRTQSRVCLAFCGFIYLMFVAMLLFVERKEIMEAVGLSLIAPLVPAFLLGVWTVTNKNLSARFGVAENGAIDSLVIKEGRQIASGQLRASDCLFIGSFGVMIRVSGKSFSLYAQRHQINLLYKFLRETKEGGGYDKGDRPL